MSQFLRLEKQSCETAETVQTDRFIDNLIWPGGFNTAKRANNNNINDTIMSLLSQTSLSRAQSLYAWAEYTPIYPCMSSSSVAIWPETLSNIHSFHTHMSYLLVCVSTGQWTECTEHREPREVHSFKGFRSFLSNNLVSSISTLSFYLSFLFALSPRALKPSPLVVFFTFPHVSQGRRRRCRHGHQI